jgi:thermostable 8-oxoguanine DNA glycosylase
MLCGANTLKVDVRVIKSLDKAGVPVNMFKDAGIYEVCRSISKELGLSMVELDSLLWLNEEKTS